MRRDGNSAKWLWPRSLNIPLSPVDVELTIGLKIVSRSNRTPRIIHFVQPESGLMHALLTAPQHRTIGVMTGKDRAIGLFGVSRSIVKGGPRRAHITVVAGG